MMNKLAVISGCVLVLFFITRVALPVQFAIDIDQDNTYENSGTVNVCGRTDVPIDIYYQGYSCPPDDRNFGLMIYITVDTSIVQINECLPNFVPNYEDGWCSPCDGSECTQLSPNLYGLTCVNWSFSFPGAPPKFGYLNVSSMGVGLTDLVVALDIGDPYNDGLFADCNLANIYPHSAVVTLENLPSPCDSDCNSDNKVNLADLVIMKEEFLREDCDVHPCQADCDGDNKVDLADLSVMKMEFLRACPYCP